MEIVVFGLGYVGTVTAACLARRGFSVVGVDVKEGKVRAVERGESPIREPETDELVADGVETGRLSATTDGINAVSDADMSFVCAGTPVDESGTVDLSAVENVVENIGEGLQKNPRDHHSVVLRSTVPPGTTRAVTETLEELSGRHVGEDFGVVMNPEFTREGSAVQDFYDPPFVVLGSDHDRALSELLDLYEEVGVTPSEVYPVDCETAELIKYASNAYHAAKVAFANEVGRICREYGVDGRTLMEIFCQDRKLNVSSAYLTPGFSFGGSCLHKDTRALLNFTDDSDYVLLESILPANDAHTAAAYERIQELDPETVGLAGLSFKAGTDDMRNSSAVYLARRLIDDGRDVVAYDVEIDVDGLVGSNRAFIEEMLPELSDIVVDTTDRFVEASDLVVICNDNPVFRSVGRSVGRVLDPVGLLRGKSGELELYDALCWGSNRTSQERRGV